MIRTLASGIAVIMAAFFSFNLFAHDNTEWRHPVDTNKWTTSSIGCTQVSNGDIATGTGDSALAAAASWVANKGCEASKQDGATSGATLTFHSFSYDEQFNDGLSATVKINYLADNVRDDGVVLYSNAARSETKTVQKESVKECTELDYPHGEDTDADGQIDHCHKTTCDRNGELMASGSQTAPVLCVANEDGTEYCEYDRIVVTDPNSINFGFDGLKATGESCGGDISDMQAPPYVAQEENDLPDPSDPNSPPSNDGNPDCTPIEGTGLNVCNVNQEDVCDMSSGYPICPTGCGTVNGIFSCITEDSGDVADTETPEDENDNSDDVTDDDPNTQGDEGTHSRLDGLLENTDGLEGLLRGIKDAIGDIPGGGGNSEQPGEDEPNCGPNEYYIGESCVTFDKNDRPENADLNFEELDAKIETAKADLTAKYNDIKAAIESKFNLNLTGGSYSPNVSTIKGASVDFGFSRLSSLFNFSMFGLVIMFVFAVKSMFVILSR